MAISQNETKNQTKAKLVIDLVIFLVFLIAMEPRSSGIPIHEWLTTGALTILVVHLLLNWDGSFRSRVASWVEQAVRRASTTF